MAMETYNGQVRTPQDAIILFEACRLGELPRVQRRLSEKERQQIKSGSVFVWDEKEAGMRRWTDGKSWSASRVSGSFLTYREMEGKRGGSNLSASVQVDPRTPDGLLAGPPSDSGPESGDDGPDGYRYKPDGLMKQSFSITNSNGDHLHLISYFARTHPAASHLNSPSNDPVLRHIRPPKGMYPESTVQEQQNIPAVTRTPLQNTGYSTMPQTAAYARNGFASAPHGHAPGPSQGPLPGNTHPGYWPHQAPSQNGHGQPGYGYHYPPSNPPINHASPGYPQIAQPPPRQQPPLSAYPHQSYLNSPANSDGRHPAGDGYHRSPGTYGDTLPPPAIHQHHRNSSSGSTRSYHDSPSNHQTTPMIRQSTTPVPEQKSFDTSSHPHANRPTPLLSVPSPNAHQHLPSLPQQHSINTPSSRSQSPLPPPRSASSDRKGSSEVIPQRPSATASEASTRPSIGALMNVNGSSRAGGEFDSKSDRSTSKSPRLKEEGSQYMPSDKVIYSGEDQRALRQLDRAFKT